MFSHIHVGVFEPLDIFLTHIHSHALTLVVNPKQNINPKSQSHLVFRF